MNTQIITIANQKGGVGKTTTCANLGIGLAQAGRKVLLIDGDPQGSLTISLGHPQPDKLPFTLSDAMGRILMDEPLKPGEGILHHPEGVDLMPADIQLSGMEVSLVNAMSRETILRQYLDTVKGQYSQGCFQLNQAAVSLFRRRGAFGRTAVLSAPWLCRKQYGSPVHDVRDAALLPAGDVRKAWSAVGKDRGQYHPRHGDPPQTAPLPHQ